MKQWKGRFRSRLHPKALAFSTSLPVDKQLYREDIEGSLAHVAMLAGRKILTKQEAQKIQRGLLAIRREIESGKLSFDAMTNRGGRFVAEDVHMAIEQRLIDTIGSVGGKLHTARSRNDQVAVDERLYLRRAIENIRKQIRILQKSFLRKAEKYSDVVMPGYTHLQQAQPLLLAHYFLAYISMIDRDDERFADCLNRVNRSPLGAGALAGTSFPIDRRATARQLKFDSVIENSIDAVADRDVLIEFLSASAITMMHLSRFAEEMVLWNSQEWHFAEIGDAFTTGSSIMPQKKNPDMAELVRGKTGRVYGSLVALLTVMKGLPLAYNRDLQEDKEPVIDTVRTVADCLEICSLMLQSTTFNSKRFEDDWQSDLLLATEVADYLVRKGMPFRSAHGIVGNIVQHCVHAKKSLKDVSLAEFKKYSRLFTDDIYSVVDLRASIARKRSEGSTSPREIQKAILRWKKKLKSR